MYYFLAQIILYYIFNLLRNAAFITAS